MEAPPPSRRNEGAALAAETLTYEGGSPAVTPPTNDPPRLQPGTSVQRFIILDRVGEGGMGVVYAAYDPSLDRRVALKFLSPHAEAGSDHVREKRLLREAQAMGRLSHPNVAVVYDVGTFRDHVFVAMEFVDGVDLRSWLKAAPRTFLEIVDVFMAAGRGLAAAHAAGIVHRDFKPENVLLDNQGRPRVTDFGLSRAAPPDPDDQGDDDGVPIARNQIGVPSTPSHLSSPLTRSGGLGTPSYMAPEQRVGGAVDARSDQFSFCIALYEAIYGEHPFSVNPADRAANAIAGRVSPAPAQSTVPKWCRQALLRGLMPAPESRFPSLGDLLAALSPYRGRRRRQVATAVSIAIIAAAGPGTYAWFSDRAPQTAAPRCDLGGQRLAGAWDRTRGQQLGDAFRRSGSRDADSTWRSFSAILDQRAKAWAAMHNEACAATHIRGEQSAAVLDLRMECLDRKRQEMKALADFYSESPDASMLDRAVSAADALPGVSTCADVANLRAVVPAPEDPAVRSKVQSLRERMSRGQALYHAGRYEQGREYMEGLKREVDGLGYAPLGAEAGEVLARHLSHLDQGAAEKVLFEAAKQAAKARDRLVEAEIALTLVATYGRAGRVPEAVLGVQVAELAVERANGDDALRGRLATMMAGVANLAGNFDESVLHNRRAAELWKKALGPRSRRYAQALANHGNALLNLGRTRESVDRLESALAIERAVLRPGHPDIAYTLDSLGQAYRNQGLLQKARNTMEAGLAIRVREFGRESAPVTYSIDQLANIEARMGNYDRAFDLFEEALSLQKRVLHPRDPYRANTFMGLGIAHMHSGRRGEAGRWFRQVIEHHARAGQPDASGAGYARAHLGQLANQRGRHGRALLECRKAFDILSRKLGPESSFLLGTRECLGEALIAAGDFEAARKELEPAMAPEIEHDAGIYWSAGARFQLGRALWAMRGERARARKLVHGTLRQVAAAEGDSRDLVTRMTAWLEKHPQSMTDTK